jgi:Ca2+-binding RTX toxin-like protein
VVLGTQTTSGTQTFTSSSTGIDTVTAKATAQSISTGGGDDVVNTETIAIFQGGTYNGGAGTNDVLNITSAGADSGIVLAATAVAGGAASVTGFEVINVTINNAADTVTITPDAAVAVNFIGNVNAELTVTGTGGAVTANGDAGDGITINGTGNVTVGGTNTTGTITFSSTKTAGTNSVTAYAGNQTVVNNSTIVTTVNGALLAGNTETLSGAGAFTVNGLVGTGTIAAAAATGVITVNGTTAGARTINTGSAADVITITGADANIQTITTLAGNDTVTLTTTGGANVVDLGAGNDTYIAGTAGGSVTGGLGSDSMTGGAGADVFIYANALDSQGVNTDTITALNFNADVIRITSALTGTTFDASTATSTTIGYNNFNVTTGVITVQTTEGTLTINTATSSNTPALTGSMQSSTALAYTLTTSNAVSTVTTGSGADSVVGGTLGDTITVGAGADTVNGGGGADVISGGEGADSITGGAGADTIVSGTAVDLVLFTSTTTAGMVTEGGDVIQSFAGLNATNTTILNFATGLLVNGTSNKLDAVTGAGTIGANDVVIIASDAIVAANDMTTAAGALLAWNATYTTQTNFANGDRVLFVGSGTATAADADSWVWLISKGAGALAAADFTYVARLVGIGDATAAVFGADAMTLAAGPGTANTDIFTIG